MNDFDAALWLSFIFILWIQPQDHLMLLSSRKVLVLKDPRELIYKSLSLSLDHKVLENCQLAINLVTAFVHDVMVKNGLLTDIRYYLL